MVDFPNPDAQTIATHSPSRTFQGYVFEDRDFRPLAKETLFNAIEPLIGGHVDPCDSWVLVDSWTSR